MTQIGLDGNDAPATMAEIPFDTWLGVQGRAFTWHEREPYRPAYGLGLTDGLRSAAPSADAWERRVAASFADISGAERFAFSVEAVGETVRLAVALRETG